MICRSDVVADAARHRYASIDTFRGAVLGLMLLTPATGQSDDFPWLRHAPWHGFTVSDWVFPAFLVTSGLSLSFLLRDPPTPTTYRRLIRRLIVLIAVGLIYNAYGASWLDLSNVRFTGVLQMIGIAGAVAAAVVLASRTAFGEDRVWWILALATAITAAYGLGLDAASCEPIDRCSPYFNIDTSVLGTSHVYRSGQVGWDPEGIVASIAAASLVLYGYAAGVILRRHGRPNPAAPQPGATHSPNGPANRLAAALRLAVLAALCLVGGLAATQWIPLNKRLLTPSFVLLASGIALAAFCAIHLLVDGPSRNPRPQPNAEPNPEPRPPPQPNPHQPQSRRWTWPFIALGRNALLVFLLERFLLQTARSVHIGDRSIQERLLEDVLPLEAPAVHLAYTTVLLLVVVATASVMHRRRLHLAL